MYSVLNRYHDAPARRIIPVARVLVQANTTSKHVPMDCQASPVVLRPAESSCENECTHTATRVRTFIFLCDCVQNMPHPLRTFTMFFLLLLSLGDLATGVLCTSPPSVRIRRCAFAAAAHNHSCGQAFLHCSSVSAGSAIHVNSMFHIIMCAAHITATGADLLFPG
jgi:hypothetical protein